MSERELRNAFRELAGGVKPAPEPYARLMARSRRRRFSRWVTGCAAAVAAVVLAPVALNAANELTPDLGPIDNSVLLITPWTRKLIDAPVRGGLANDPTLLDEAGKLLRAMKSGPMHGYPTKVLFAEDVGDTSRCGGCALQQDPSGGCGHGWPARCSRGGADGLGLV